ESALAVDYAGNPGIRDALSAEEALEFALSHVDGEHTERPAILENGDFYTGNPVLRDVASVEVGCHDRMCRQRAALRFERRRIAAWQDLPGLGQGVHELAAVRI